MPDVRIEKPHWDQLRRNKLFVCPKIYVYDGHPAPKNDAVVQATKDAFPDDRRYHASAPIVTAILRQEAVSYFPLVGVVHAFNALYTKTETARLDEDNIVAGVFALPTLDRVIQEHVNNKLLPEKGLDEALEEKSGIPYWFLAQVRGGSRLHYSALDQLRQMFLDLSGTDVLKDVTTDPKVVKPTFRCTLPN